MPTEGFTPFEDYGYDGSVRGLVAGQKVLNRYTLKRVLGRGGMGVVWLVHDEELDRSIAFKFLPDVVCHDKAAVDSLKKETRRSLELTHPNIVRIYDFAQDEHCAGISMEYVAGDTLSNLRTCQPTNVFDADDLRPWVTQLCNALDYAHNHALVAHRDLKPANLMLTNKGQLKIADFGISRSLSDNMTRVSSAVQGASGTLVYMSPQQAFGDPASVLDDIYSFGATIYELLTSKPPFFTGEILAQVREKLPPRMTDRRRQLGVEGKPIPIEWEETILACLAKKPEDRPQSARELLERLKLVETTSSEAAPKTSTTTIQLEAPKKAEAAMPAASAQPAADIPPVEKPTTELKVPPPEFIIDSNGFKLASPIKGQEGDPKTSVPQRTVRRWVGAAVVCLLLLAVYFGNWYATRHERLDMGLGGLVISTEPAGATVKVKDGASLVAPGRLLNLHPGRHTLVASAPGHYDKEVDIDVTANKFVTVPPIVLRPFSGKLVLVSDPPGATFSVDGKPVTEDDSKALVVELSPGKHEVVANYAGWSPQRRRIDVTKDEEAKEVFAFYPGVVEITSSPAGAKVMAGNQELGRTPLTLTDVQPGDVMYVLVKDDYNPEVVKGVVQPKLKLSLDKKLTKERGTLVLSSPMPGVEFYLDLLPLGQLKAGQTLETNLSPGRHEITAILPGWPKQEQSVEITRDKVSSLQFDFSPASVLVTSDPPGATVVMRGTNLGVTPYSMREVRPGQLSLLVQMAGFDPVTIETNVLSGETLPLQVTLPRMSRPVRFNITPSDALVSIDGVWLTNRPPRFAVGKYTMHIERPGYESRDVEVEIKADGVNDLGEYVLKRTVGNLEVLITPANATFEVFVDGTSRVAHSAERLTGIPTGKHRVLVKSEGYDPQYVDVEVKADQTVRTDSVVLTRSKGDMRVISSPAAARFNLVGPDQVMREGTTPIDETGLPTGTYQITFTKAGYETTNVTVTVTTLGTVAAEAQLRRTQGGLHVAANRAGSEYVLKGQDGYYSEGKLPLDIKALPTGRYELTVDNDGYDPVKEGFELKPNENRVFDLKLQRSKGALTAVIAPADASARLVGKGFDKPVISGSRMDDVPTGEYRLVASYKNWSTTNQVSIQRGQNTGVKIALPFGRVHLESTPGGATVVQGSKVLGETPLTLDELPLGPVKFQLRKAGHRFADVQLTVQAQREEKITRKLEPFPGPQPGMTEWVNSLGMRFVPVGDLWVCVWETRVRDFTEFYNDTRYNAGVDWRDPGFKQDRSHPVVAVSWQDASAFCQWLTQKETKAGLVEQATYRMPTLKEWTRAWQAGHPEQAYIWGNTWPIPSGVANLSDNISYDRFSFTAPAGSFPPNKLGLFDMVGNVWEWCQDGDGLPEQHSVKGESWLQYPGGDHSPGMERLLNADERARDIGFRIVLVTDGRK